MKPMNPDTIIKQLEYDRETVERWRALVARLGSTSAAEAQASTAPRHGPRKTRHKRRAGRGITGICEASLGTDWNGVDFFWEKVKAKNPKTQRAVVALALRRLEQQGIAEKKGDRAQGVEFRQKATA
jgi:hypothetical protein